MQVCEEALKNLKNSKRRPIKGTLHISGDGLRVSDSDTKGLVLDQTIEKVSFCAPDRNYEKGFSYICRDGTTRRWLCHGFMASKDSGERLSHAVGCAFAICLEKKQKRDKECAVQMSYDSQQNTFTRFGSFRQGTITERLQDPQNFKPLEPLAASSSEPVANPNAVARPKVSDLMYLRQASFRGFGQLSGSSPFKRQFSLRLNELPSTLARQARDSGSGEGQELEDARLGGLAAASCQFSPIKEDAGDTDLLSPDLAPVSSQSPVTVISSNPGGILLPTPCPKSPLAPVQETQEQEVMSSPPPIQMQSPSFNPWDNVPDQPLTRARPASYTSSDINLPLDDWLHSSQLSNLTLFPTTCSTSSSSTSTSTTSSEQTMKSNNKPPSFVSTKSHSLDHYNYQTPASQQTASIINSNSHKEKYLSLHQQSNSISDPFDADWVNLAMRNDSQVTKNTNPFLQDSIKTFELKM